MNMKKRNLTQDRFFKVKTDVINVESPNTHVTTGNITFGSIYKYYKNLPLELFRALAVGT